MYYELTFNTGVVIKFTPDKLKTSKNISDFDAYYFTIEYKEEENRLLKERNLNYLDIISRKIVKGNYRYNVLGTKKYFGDIFDNLYTGNTGAFRNYEYEVVRIKNSSDNLIEMKEYIFDQLKHNKDDFFNKVLIYDSNIKKLLKRYVDLKSTDLMNSEDVDYLYEIEGKVMDELTVYSNYRKIAVSRSFYEKIGDKRKSNQVTPSIHVDTKVDIEYRRKREEEKLANMGKIDDMISEFNRSDLDKEEFIETEEEYNMMRGGETEGTVQGRIR